MSLPKAFLTFRSSTGEPWTEEELATLSEAAALKKKQDGTIKWAAVAAELPGRTDNDVTRQFLKLK